jgi:hypothetical protein
MRLALRCFASQAEAPAVMAVVTALTVVLEEAAAVLVHAAPTARAGRGLTVTIPAAASTSLLPSPSPSPAPGAWRNLRCEVRWDCNEHEG